MFDTTGGENRLIRAGPHWEQKNPPPGNPAGGARRGRGYSAVRPMRTIRRAALVVVSTTLVPVTT